MKSNPIPDNGACTLAANAELATARLPVCCPALAGVNVTPTAQLVPGASVLAQLLLAIPNPFETVKARSVSGTVALLLVTVKVWALLVVPTPVVAKVNCDGCSCTVPAAPPVPLNAMVAVFNVAEPTVNEPATLPFPVGVNTTPTVQFAPAARTAAQLFCVRLNGVVTASVSPVAFTLLVLLIVAVCAALVWPRADSVNVICAGLTFNPDAASPAPLNATVTAFTPRVEEVTVRVAAFAPVAAGVKITCTVQLLPLLNVAPHVDAPAKKLPTL